MRPTARRRSVAMLLLCHAIAPWGCATDAEPALAVDGAPADAVPADAGPGDPLHPPAVDGPRPVRLAVAPRNLLILSVDTLRRDAVGRFGGQGGDTPFLDALLAQSVVLEDFQSCANNTPPAFLCLYTGAAVHDGVFELREGRDGVEVLPAGLSWASSRLRAAGFRTGTAMGSPLMGAMVPDFMAGFDDVRTPAWDAVEVTDDALELAAEYAHETRRWFLHVHYMEPHAPLEPPEKYLQPLAAGLPPADPSWTFGQVWMRQLHRVWPTLDGAQQAALLAHTRARYRASVRYFDDELQRLWIALDGLGLLEDTLVLLWADHGEQFNEHGRWTHAYSLHHEELATIAGFWARGLPPASWTGPTDTPDLLPTLLDALGLPPDSPARRPESMTGYVVGTAPPDRPRLVTWHSGERDIAQLSLRVGGRALLLDAAGAASVYDMVADPGQQLDRAATNPDELAALWEALVPMLPLLGGAFPSEPALPAGLPR